MSAELAMITGLGLVAFLALKISNRFKEAESMMEEGTALLSMLFLVGLQYAGHGIASSNAFSNAQDAYLVGLLVTVTLFTGLMIELILNYWNQTQEDNEFGYFGEQ